MLYHDYFCTKLYYFKIFNLHFYFGRIAPKLVFILSGWSCNAIYRNPNEAHVFCGASSFQQAPVDVCISKRSRVTAGFVKTIACTPPKKGEKSKQNPKFIYSHHLYFPIVVSIFFRLTDDRDV